MAEQPEISGIEVVFNPTISVGELPWDLHLSAEADEKRLFGLARQPAAIVMRLEAVNADEIDRDLSKALCTLQLHGSGSTSIREAWIFDESGGRLDEQIQLRIRAFDPGEEFALRAGINEDALTGAFQRVAGAMDSHRKLEVTVEHLLMALGRYGLSRGLVDATICLESLIDSKEEVGFRFSQQIGRVVSEGPRNLADVQPLLKDLYSYRSKHVHGNRDTGYYRLQERMWDSWTEIERLLKTCVTYALEFHGVPRDASSWQTHLDGLMLGTEVRLTPEWGTAL